MANTKIVSFGRKVKLKTKQDLYLWQSDIGPKYSILFSGIRRIPCISHIIIPDSNIFLSFCILSVTVCVALEAVLSVCFVAASHECTRIHSEHVATNLLLMVGL